MESRLIDWLRDRLPDHPLLQVGLGDDAAVLRMAGAERIVMTTDLLSDGVDFVVGEMDPRRIGHKALAVNLSDLAAMAAQPMAGVVSLLFPHGADYQLAVGLFEGMLPLAEQFSLAMAGGDTNCWPGGLAISITLLGQVTERGPLLRGEAQPGDAVVVSGAFGGSILGRHLDVCPRVNEALALHQGYTIHAGIDCSDGLSLDLSRLAEESGRGATLDAGRIPIHDDARQLSRREADGATPLDHALADGEDFELILAVPPDEAQRMVAEQPLDVMLTIVGEVTAERGLRLRDPSGKLQELRPRGWQHG